MPVGRRLALVGAVVAVGAGSEERHDGGARGLSRRHDERRYAGRRLHVGRSSERKKFLDHVRAAFRCGIVKRRPVGSALRVGSGFEELVKEFAVSLEDRHHERRFAEAVGVVEGELS